MLVLFDLAPHQSHGVILESRLPQKTLRWQIVSHSIPSPLTQKGTVSFKEEKYMFASNIDPRVVNFITDEDQSTQRYNDNLNEYQFIFYFPFIVDDRSSCITLLLDLFDIY